ncbi:MAG: hypothetical protein EAZ95_01645 [Bacteroidetes bacterium]|nr:MAG: hypothetical protein EAZ95_01645 [Bacteroidota bacterium]
MFCTFFTNCVMTAYPNRRKHFACAYLTEGCAFYRRRTAELNFLPTHIGKFFCLPTQKNRQKLSKNVYFLVLLWHKIEVYYGK